MYDILIKNGTIIDGSGAPMFKGDIAIKEDEIVRIGELDDEKGEIEIDAEGMMVTPGFIDVNNHSDTYWQIFKDPNLESLIYQGITTIVGGNCGSSLAPLVTPETIETIQKWVDLRHVNVNWLTVKEFFKVLKKNPLSVNFATLTGHATLRRGVIKDEMRSPTADELAFIKKMLNQSMKDGSLGMSTGLVYTHARLATTDELVGLAGIVKDFEGVYVTHIRNELNDFLEAVEEAVKIAQDSKAKLHISHLKVMGEKNWPMMQDALNLLDIASQGGCQITFDVYPYTYTGSVLYTFLPAWVSEGGKNMMLQRLRDPSVKSRIIEDMKRSGFDYSKIEVATSPLNRTLARKKITEIAFSQEKSIEEAVVDTLLASEGRVITSIEALSEDNIRKAISHPLSIIASNGSGFGLDHAQTGELIHPRSFGTFPRVLYKYVMQEKILTWEEAIRKMTGLPAEKFGIGKRGFIKEKYQADIVIFDRDKIRDKADKKNPYHYSEGIDFVIVNGKLELSQGAFIGVRNGQIIKR